MTKITIVGAGSIGGFLGVKISLSCPDAKISLIARGAHLKAVNENGLTLILNDGTRLNTQKCFATDNLEKITEIQDIIILTVKAHQLPDLAAKLGPLIGKQTMVVPMQNGIPWWYFQKFSGPPNLQNSVIRSVDPDGTLFSSINPENIIGCVVYPACHISEPGVIQHTEGWRFPIGELDGQKTERIERLSKIFSDSGFKAYILDDIRSEIWLKLWGTLVWNPVSALTHGTLQEICTFPLTRSLAVDMMEEAKSIANFLGASFRVPMEKRIEGAASVGHHKTSMCQDVENGRGMEIDAVLGSVLELGVLSNIVTPHIKAVHACTKLLDKVITEHNIAIKPANK